MLTAEEWEILRLSMKVALVERGRQPARSRSSWRYLLARYEFPGKSLFDAFVHLPLVLPPVVIGYFLLLLLGRRGPIGALLDQYFGIVLSFRWTGAAVACAVMGFPLMVRAIRLSLEAVDEKLEAAARTLGASRLRVLATVTLPLALPGIITGVLLSFARSLGEFGATITFVSNIPGETRTLPLAIYTYTQVPERRRVRDAIEPDRGRAYRWWRCWCRRSWRGGQRRRQRAGMLRVDVQRQVGSLDLAAAFEADDARHGALRTLGSGQDLGREHDRAACCVPIAAASRSKARCCSTAPPE